MTVDKKISYEIQGGAKNYLGKQKEVTAPIKWKSSPDSPETELAYITKAEKDLLVKKDLHGSLKNGVNRGPSGIMSLDGYGSFDGPDPTKDTGMSGVATSAAESGGGSGADRKELESYISRDQMTSTRLPPGVTKQLPQNIREYRDAFIAAGGGQRVNPGFFDSRNTVSRAELARAKAFNPAAFKAVRGGGLSSFLTGGGFIGNLIRGLGQAFGLGKKYDEPTYDMSGINTRVYEGTMDPTVNPEYYNDLDNELMLSTEASPASGFVTATATGTEYPGANKFRESNLNFEGPDYLKSFEGLYSLPEKKDFLDNTFEDYQIVPNSINAYQAKVTKDDINRSKSRAFKSMDYDTYKMIVPNTQVTPYEFDQLQKGKIKEPGTYKI